MINTESPKTKPSADQTQTNQHDMLLQSGIKFKTNKQTKQNPHKKTQNHTKQNTHTNIKKMCPTFNC